MSFNALRENKILAKISEFIEYRKPSYQEGPLGDLHIVKPSFLAYFQRDIFMR